MFRHVKFASAPVRDQDRAVGFYRDVLGLTLVNDTPYGDDWRWIEFEIPGAATRILFARAGAEAPGPEPALILVCEDVDAAHSELAARGVRFTQEPTAAPWSPQERFALFADSEGNVVMLGSGA
ncbi:MAG: VOC family protein [Phenylobacterium sp.]|uniref:VOC family protein n=1 Tax=Phenylobacterium sp. TaxID=1871053 RepID=UPI0039188C03